MNTQHRWRNKSLSVLKGLVMGILSAGIFLWVPTQAQAEELTVDERIKRWEQRLEKLRGEVKEAKKIDLTTVEERLAKLEKKQPPSEGGEIGNMVFFRGGGAWLANDRSNEVFTDVFGIAGSNNGTAGWYVGGGLDLVISKDVWGMMSETWVLGEIGVEFKRFNSKKVAQAVPTTCAFAGVPSCSANLNTKVQLTMLTVDIAPKIKFFEKSDFRPWIIPAGLDFHVISPPSNDTTVLDIGVQFAAGAEYRIWKAFHIGVDGRYHLTANETDTINNFGTVGGYVGIGF